MSDYNDFYDAANRMMYNSVVNQAFSYTSADSARYGSSATGNACLVASQVLKANQGTRFIQITSNDGWDMHVNIYQGTTSPATTTNLDNAVSALLGDLEFERPVEQHAGGDGRRVRAHRGSADRRRRTRPLAAAIRFFAGGGVKGGAILGATNYRGPIRWITAGRRIATSTPKISRRPSTPPWASTGPPCATTIHWVAASAMSPPPIPCSMPR